MLAELPLVALDRQHWTPSQLAEATGITMRQLAALFESERQNLKLDIVDKRAEALDIDPATLS